MPETEAHKLPYPAAGDPADVPADMQALAEAVDGGLSAIDLSQLSTGGTGDDGKLVIVQDGAAAYAAMKGDATLAEDGTLTIGTGAVTAPKLGGLAVETAKINNGAVTEGKIANGSVTSAKLAGVYKTLEVNSSSGGSFGTIDIPAPGIYAIQVLCAASGTISGGTLKLSGDADAIYYALAGTGGLEVSLSPKTGEEKAFVGLLHAQEPFTITGSLSGVTGGGTLFGLVVAWGLSI